MKIRLDCCYLEIEGVESRELLTSGVKYQSIFITGYGY
jgi:hypothetical protein